MWLLARLSGIGAIASLLAGGAAAADSLAVRDDRPSAACIEISTAKQLDAIRDNPAADFCLTADIDAGSLGNFAPLPKFSGTFDGREHAIRNLTIASAGELVGLFTEITKQGQVRNLRIVADVTASRADYASAGVLAGGITGLKARVVNVHASGSVRAVGTRVQLGGLVGVSYGAVSASSAAVAVSAEGGSAGGLVGTAVVSPVQRSHATGPVSIGSGKGAGAAAAGGLVGMALASPISQSHASGPVLAGTRSYAGGLLGQGLSVTITQSYALGEVGTTGEGSYVAALIGQANDFGDGPTMISESYGAGRVSPALGSTAGGLVAAAGGLRPVVESSYWDTETTGQSASAGGIGRSTGQMRRLVSGFNPGVWAVTPDVSHPYLATPRDGFQAALASLVSRKLVYTFPPIDQLDPDQYARTPQHADGAALAAVYTMLARGLGVTMLDARLSNAPIDRYFWKDGTAAVRWTGPVKDYARLGEFVEMSPAGPVPVAVIEALAASRPVILRGAYEIESGEVQHWMLATSYTVDERGEPDSIVADDPWTGEQVRLSLAKRRVSQPKSYPLPGFRLDGYQVVTLKN